MNREILFRGKRIDGKGWVYGSIAVPNRLIRGVYIMPDCNTADLCPGFEDGDDIADYYGQGITLGRFIEVDPATVGQFTGLLDKNGVKIWEGDILRKPADLWIGNESVGDKKGTFDDDAFVEYHDGTFRINQIGNEAKLYYGVINYSRNTGVDVMEVIGNIHDNPELIK